MTERPRPKSCEGTELVWLVDRLYTLTGGGSSVAGSSYEGLFTDNDLDETKGFAIVPGLCKR